MDLPIKHGDFPVRHVGLPEGIHPSKTPRIGYPQPQGIPMGTSSGAPHPEGVSKVAQVLESIGAKEKGLLNIKIFMLIFLPGLGKIASAPGWMCLQYLRVTVTHVLPCLFRITLEWIRPWFLAMLDSSSIYSYFLGGFHTLCLYQKVESPWFLPVPVALFCPLRVVAQSSKDATTDPLENCRHSETAGATGVVMTIRWSIKKSDSWSFPPEMDSTSCHTQKKRKDGLAWNSERPHDPSLFSISSACSMNALGKADPELLAAACREKPRQKDPAGTEQWTTSAMSGFVLKWSIPHPEWQFWWGKWWSTRRFEGTRPYCTFR